MGVSTLAEKKSSRIIVTRREIITRYEVFCEEGKPFTSNVPTKEIIINTSESPLRLLDRFGKERQEIIECINNLRTNFSDLEERQINFVELKSKLLGLRRQLTLAQTGFLRSVNMCIDSLENTRAELMSKKQLDALESALKMIYEATEDFEVNLIQEILINSGLKPIPNLEGISEFY